MESTDEQAVRARFTKLHEELTAAGWFSIDRNNFDAMAEIIAGLSDQIAAPEFLRNGRERAKPTTSSWQPPSDLGFLIHIVPRFCTRYIPATIHRVEIPELEITLNAGKELMTGHPYPNKRYCVACPKGRTHYDGFFIQTPMRVPDFTTKMYWKLANGLIIAHEVTQITTDTEFPTTSWTASKWCGVYGRPWIASRYPENAPPPVKLQPTMIFETDSEDDAESRCCNEIINFGGSLGIIKSSETYHVPTINPERLLDSVFPSERLPPLETAFRR